MGISEDLEHKMFGFEMAIQYFMPYCLRLALVNPFS
jgi:hypothetical protein